MLLELARVFVDVVLPVFAVVGLGWALGPRLGLEARTLSRAAYHLFVPAFTFHVIATSRVPLARAAAFAGYVVAAHLAFALLGWLAARLVRASRETTAAFVMLGVFGNVGNYGLALVRFRLGEAGVVPATLYFVVSLLVSFVVCVGVATAVRGGGAKAVLSVLRTPALVAAVPALLVSALGLRLPLALGRGVALLADAMIPVMLLALGLQLAAAGALRPTRDVVLATGLRLVASPLVAFALAAAFGLGGVERSASVLQAAMPAAVLVAIISAEHAVAPPFVMSTVFFSTLASVPVLTVLLALL
jgi:predicted permease